MAYPVTLLSSWILVSILENVETRDTFVSDTLMKRFIQYREPNVCSIKYTPLVRILAFTQTTSNGEIVAVVNDSTHKIAVLFTREAIRKFEIQYGQRHTFHSVHTLVTLQQANLKFISRLTHSSFYRALQGIAASSLRGNSLLYLEVNEVKIFVRDAHTVPASADNTLKFVYVEHEYQELFMATSKQNEVLPRHSVASLQTCDTKARESSLLEFNDEMLSEVDDEESWEVASSTQHSDTSSPNSYFTHHLF